MLKKRKEIVWFYGDIVGDNVTNLSNLEKRK